jgi:putative ABC transport system permease protein
VRAFVQLLAVGAVLTLLFTEAGLVGALAWVAGMVVVAGFVAAGRSKELPRARFSALVSVGVGVVLTLGVLLVAGVVEPVPSVVVPVGGMVVSAAMTATNLSMRHMVTIATQQRRDIEARLALGLTADDAIAAHLRGAVRTALLPAIDTTKVVGLIALPGAMTGLILAGVEPIDAIRYQIVVMYMLLAAASVSAIVAARLARQALFDDADRLRWITTG